MGILITKSDFVGVYAIPKTINDNIDAFINECEEQYLIDLLGVELYDLFKADLVNKIPQTNIYLTIYNKFTEAIGSFVYSSIGMKNMLLGYLYFEITRDNNTKNTSSGQVVNTVETSVRSGNAMLFKKHNDSIKTHKVIQTYILDNLDVYPTFKGIVKNYSSPF